MAKHWKYLKYLCRHKWFVFVAGLRVKAPLWRLIIHDWSKLMPCEWMPYVEYFYTDRQSTEFFDLVRKYGVAEMAPWGECVKDRFSEAWLHHQHYNPHHWQYWILRNDDQTTFPIPMPERFAREMVADWMGAGRAITGKWEADSWYLKNREKIVLREETRVLVEKLLKESRHD